MRILQIVSYFPPHLGGQERHVYDLSRHLARRGHEVTVLTSDIPPTRGEEVVEGVQVKRLPSITNPMRNPIAPAMLAESLNLRSYDLVHAHNEFMFGSLVCTMFGRDVPMVLTCHGRVIYGNDVLDGIVKVYDRTLGRLIFRRAARIVTLSLFDKQLITANNVRPDKVVVLPNATDTEELDSHEASEDGGGEGTTLLYVGACTRRKGLDVLIYSLPMLIQRFPDRLILNVVGEGDFLNEARRSVEDMGLEDRVRFFGPVTDRGKLMNIYRGSDIFVLPSLSEGMPLVLLEAMHFGLPTVVTALPVVRELFSDHVVQVEPGDRKGLADGITRVIEDRELAEHLSARGKQYVDAELSWKEMAGRYERLYYEVIASAR